MWYSDWRLQFWSTSTSFVLIHCLGWWTGNLPGVTEYLRIGMWCVFQLAPNDLTIQTLLLLASWILDFPILMKDFLTSQQTLFSGFWLWDTACLFSIFWTCESLISFLYNFLVTKRELNIEMTWVGKEWRWHIHFVTQLSRVQKAVRSSMFVH